MSYEKVSVTLKAHGGFDAPWIVVKGDSADEVSGHLERLRELGAFSAVKTIAAEFTDAPTSDEAVANVQAAMPGTEQVTPDASLSGTPSTAEPPKQSVPPCETCGKPTRFKSGTSQNGPYKAWICSSGDKTHTTWLKG